MSKLQKALLLNDEGYKDLKKAAFACTLTNFSMIVPVIVLTGFVIEVLKPFSGETVSYTKLWALFVAGVAGAFLVYFCQRYDYRKTYVTSYTQSEQTRVAVAEHIRRLPMSVFNNKNLSDLTTSIMGDVANTEHAISHVVPQLIANGISVTVICFLIALYDRRMALAIFAVAPVSFAIIVLSRVIYGGVSKKYTEAKLQASDRVQEYIEGIKVIRACNMDGERSAALTKALRDMMDLAIRVEFGTGVFTTGAQTVLQAGIGITVLTGTVLFTGRQISFVPLVLFLFIVVRIYGPVVTLLTLLPELFYLQIGMRRMRDLMSITPMQGSGETCLKDFDIICEHINFSYNQDGEQTIHDLSLSIPAGGVTALVGPSGSGKSTVSRLIARFWDVDSGRITIGGKDVKTLDPEHLMGYMSFVFQDVVLFNDTIFGNIKIGNMEASEEQVLVTAKAACCDEFVAKLPDGYKTMLGENGATLSGGERQRISIARALLKDAPIVLLDEATASLDPENEAQVQKAISELVKGRTVIVIAHRLYTVIGADKIAVLEKGRLVEEGTGAELLAKNGLFAKLYMLQQERMGWAAGEHFIKTGSV
jgi:ATP-binding cassette subfamily B protein